MSPKKKSDGASPAPSRSRAGGKLGAFLVAIAEADGRFRVYAVKARTAEDALAMAAEKANGLATVEIVGLLSHTMGKRMKLEDGVMLPV